MNKRLVTYLAILALAFVSVTVYGMETNQLTPRSVSFASLQLLVSSLGSESRATTSPEVPSVASSDSQGVAAVTDVTATATKIFFYGSSTEPIKTNATVVRAVDGDTLVARFDGSSGNTTVRFLGINTPETVDPRKPVQCFGKEASKHVHSLIDGHRVLLVADPQADDVDKYGRDLRNVVLEDGTDLDAQLVSDGYAYAYLSFPLSPLRKRELKNLEENAKMAQRGLWSPQTCDGKF